MENINLKKKKDTSDMINPGRPLGLSAFKRIFANLSILLFPLIFACNKPAETLPETLFDYSLKKKLVGSEAEEYVNRLHQQRVSEAKTEIGFYEDGKGTPLLIYIASFKDGTAAEKNYRDMTDKISPDNSVFIGGEFIEVGGKQIYRCFGMGQTHFVFVKGNRLFWVSVNTLRAMDLIEQFLNFIQ